MWEVITYGGGVYLVDIFNAVAALTNGTAYVTALKIFAATALFWLMAQTALTNNWAVNLRWFATFLVMNGVLFVPKVTVQITDPLNPTLPGATVANVPWGLAVFASETSMIGNELTTQSETVFSLPSSLTYSQNGMIFASRLENLLPQMQITDADFAANMQSFMQQCVFYDLLLNKYSLNDLKQAPNMWTFVTQTNTPSPARSFQLVSGGTSTIVTCAAGAVTLNTTWTTEITNDTKIFGSNFFSGQDAGTASTNLTNDLPAAHQYLLGVSRTASDLMQQAMMVNATNQAMQGMSGSNDLTAGLQVYAQTKADMETQQTYQTMGRLAGEWIPVLKVVLEALFYGAFPIAFMMMLLPGGIGVLKNYAGGFVWLQSWGPLYAILNRVMEGYAAINTQANAYMPAGSDLSMVTMNGIQAINNDVAVLAGYLTMSIPMLAYAITKGAGAMVGIASTAVHGMERNAQTTAGEAVSGNISMGETHLDEYSGNNMNANHVQTSGLNDTMRNTFVRSDGTSITTAKDGSSGSIINVPRSQLPTDMHFGDQVSQEARVQGQAAEHQGHQLMAKAGQSYSSSYGAVAELATAHGSDTSVDNALRSSSSASVAHDVSKIQDLATQYSRSHGGTVADATRAFAEASAGGGFGIPGTGIGVEGKVGTVKDRNASQSNENKQVQEFVEKNNIGDLFKNVAEGTRSSGLDIRTHDGASLSDRITGGYTQGQQFEKQATDEFGQSRQYAEMASTAHSESAGLNRNLNQDYVNWARDQQSPTGGRLGNDGIAALYSPDNPHPDDIAHREQMERSFIHQYVAQHHDGTMATPQQYRPSEAAYQTDAARLEAGQHQSGAGLVQQVHQQAAAAGVPLAVDGSGVRKAVDGTFAATANGGHEVANQVGTAGPKLQSDVHANADRSTVKGLLGISPDHPAAPPCRRSIHSARRRIPTQSPSRPAPHPGRSGDQPLDAHGDDGRCRRRLLGHRWPPSGRRRTGRG